jgi:hypothetical protein
VKRGFLFGLHHLVEAYTLLLQPSFTRVVEDALIVAFCTHARNLLEFFFRRPDGYFAIARDYATTSYETLKYEDVKEEFERLCAQINHLTCERTDDDNKKNWPCSAHETHRDHPHRSCSVGGALTIRNIDT